MSELPVEGIGLDMIQGPKPEPRIMRYELTDFELLPPSFLPNKPRGIPRVDDRRVLNGIFWVLRPAIFGLTNEREVFASSDRQNDQRPKANGRQDGERRQPRSR